VTVSGSVFLASAFLLAASAFSQGGWIAGVVLAVASIWFVTRKVRECKWAMNAILRAFDEQRQYEKTGLPAKGELGERNVNQQPDPIPVGSEDHSLAIGAHTI